MENEKATLKYWFLTWENGGNGIIIAPTKEAAVAIANIDSIITVDEIDSEDINFKIYLISGRLKEIVDDLLALTGFMVTKKSKDE